MDKEFDAREVYIRQPRPPSALHPEFPNPQNPSSQLPTLDSESSAAPNPEFLKPEQSAPQDPGILNIKALHSEQSNLKFGCRSWPWPPAILLLSVTA